MESTSSCILCRKSAIQIKCDWLINWKTFSSCFRCPCWWFWYCQHASWPPLTALYLFMYFLHCTAPRWPPVPAGGGRVSLLRGYRMRKDVRHCSQNKVLHTPPWAGLITLNKTNQTTILSLFMCLRVRVCLTHPLWSKYFPSSSLLRREQQPCNIFPVYLLLKWKFSCFKLFLANRQSFFCATRTILHFVIGLLTDVFTQI